MALQTSGQITLNDLRNEFGGDASLDNYYRGGGRVPNIPANNSVPTSGQIRLSNFYGALNGVPLRIDIIGGGGGGGGGSDGGQGAPSDKGDDGNRSIISDGTLGGSTIVQAAGGVGGRKGGQFANNPPSSAGEDGQASAFGPGGTGEELFSKQSVPNFTTDAPATSYGAGGGGGFGSSDLKGVVIGGGGNGGRAGTRNTGTYLATAPRIRCGVGNGGDGDVAVSSTFSPGGKGAGGRIRIRDGFDGDVTFTNADNSVLFYGYYRVY